MESVKYGSISDWDNEGERHEGHCMFGLGSAEGWAGDGE